MLLGSASTKRRICEQQIPTFRANTLTSSRLLTAAVVYQELASSYCNYYGLNYRMVRIAVGFFDLDYLVLGDIRTGSKNEPIMASIQLMNM